MPFTLYAHINVCDKDAGYVGFTSRSMLSRWRSHCRTAKLGRSKSLFHEALRMWGFSDDTWKHVVLEAVSTRKEAKEAEKRWVRSLNTYAYDPAGHGYNMTRGGNGASGKPWTLTRREKMSSVNRDKQLELDTKALISVNAIDGMKRSGAAKKIGAKSKGRTPFNKGQRTGHRSDSGAYLRKPIRQFNVNDELIAEFRSIREAAQQFENVASAGCGISACCRGDLRTSHGFVWKYAQVHVVGKQVTQYSLKGTIVATYPSLAIASKMTGISSQSISNCCHNKTSVSGGYLWSFCEPKSGT